MSKNAQLCNVMQGVQFTVQDEETTVKAVILKEALERHFGASTEPKDWIRAYRRHQNFIDDAALRLHHLQPIWPVIVLRGHEPQLGPMPREKSTQPTALAR
jgi:uncharacterized protein DUF1488